MEWRRGVSVSLPVNLYNLLSLPVLFGARLVFVCARVSFVRFALHDLRFSFVTLSFPVVVFRWFFLHLKVFLAAVIVKKKKSIVAM